MRCFAASASAMSTPASAYFIEDLFSCWSGTNTFPLFSLGRKWVRQPGGGPVTLYRFCREEGLKRSEQSSPAYQARMHQGIRVCKEALANLAGLPRIGRYIEGHVNHDRRTDNVIARNAVPEAAVVGIAAIVAHHKIGIRRNFVRHLQVVRIGTTNGVILDQPLPIDPHRSVMNVNGISRQADHALDVIRRVRSKRGLEDDYLLAMRITPQRHMPIGEWNARVVPDATHNQVVADQQGIFHRARRNHARLTDGPVDQQKHQRDPEPRDDFVLDPLPYRHARLRFFIFLGFSCHVPPSPDARLPRLP